MAQNTSSAVMQQRQEARDSLDFFPTPAWATRALCEHVLPAVWWSPQMTACDPACGEGHMARPLGEYFAEVIASDVHSYGFGAVQDFLFPHEATFPDWIITNPPFRLAHQFIEQGLNEARGGVAMLVRTSFLEGVDRFERLFSVTPPAVVAQFVERVPMVKGRVDRAAASATSYAWLVWRCGDRRETKLVWIPPCRKRLERDDDYTTQNTVGRTFPGAAAHPDTAIQRESVKRCPTPEDHASGLFGRMDGAPQTNPQGDLT